MARYRIKKDTKHITAVVGEGNIGPYHLYSQLKDDYPEISFVIMHDSDNAECYFNDPNTGKHGYICMSDTGKKLGDLGISKEEYEAGDFEEICGCYEDQTVPVESYEGYFRDFVLNYPGYVQLCGDAYPSSVLNPLSGDHGNPDWNSFDVVIEF